MMKNSDEEAIRRAIIYHCRQCVDNKPDQVIADCKNVRCALHSVRPFKEVETGANLDE